LPLCIKQSEENKKILKITSPNTAISGPENFLSTQISIFLFLINNKNEERIKISLYRETLDKIEKLFITSLISNNSNLISMNHSKQIWFIRALALIILVVLFGKFFEGAAFNLVIAISSLAIIGCTFMFRK
jgi:hypothetical protein